MSDSSDRVRSGRTSPTISPLVAVTAAGSPVGRAVVAALARRVGGPAGPRGVLAVEAGVPGTLARDLPAKVRMRSADLATPAVRAALAGADVVVHVAHTADQGGDRLSATARRARAVRSVQEVAAAAAAVGAGRLLVVSSAMVYGARADNPVPLRDDAPLAASRDDGVVGDLLEVERIVARLPKVHPELRTTVLRPAALVGPGVDTMITRHLRAAWLLALRGEPMAWQFCHVDDLADAVALALEADLDGVLAAGCLPWLTNDELETITGMRRLELPARLAHATAERLRRAGTLPTPEVDLAFVVHPWVVGAERLRAAGWQARHDAMTCVLQVREHTGSASWEGVPGALGVEPREAVLGAAGAAVAILGTAALLRQARARRSGRHRPRL